MGLYITPLYSTWWNRSHCAQLPQKLTKTAFNATAHQPFNRTRHNHQLSLLISLKDKQLPDSQGSRLPAHWGWGRVPWVLRPGGTRRGWDSPGTAAGSGTDSPHGCPRPCRQHRAQDTGTSPRPARGDLVPQKGNPAGGEWPGKTAPKPCEVQRGEGRRMEALNTQRQIKHSSNSVFRKTSET